MLQKQVIIFPRFCTYIITLFIQKINYNITFYIQVLTNIKNYISNKNIYLSLTNRYSLLNSRHTRSTISTKSPKTLTIPFSICRWGHDLCSNRRTSTRISNKQKKRPNGLLHTNRLYYYDDPRCSFRLKEKHSNQIITMFLNTLFTKQ